MGRIWSMDAIDIILRIVVGVVILLQIIVSARLFRASSLTGEQKAYQISLVWLLPILGCGIVWITNRRLDAEASTTPRDRHFVPDEREEVTDSKAGDVSN